MVDFTELRAPSHQLMALLASLAPPSAVAVLGGGGMALPMAMLASGYAGRVHVVELHRVVPWRVKKEEFGAGTHVSSFLSCFFFPGEMVGFGTFGDGKWTVSR